MELPVTRSAELAHDPAEASADDCSALPAGMTRELLPPRGAIRFWVLLLLDERPGHGYDLIQRMDALGFHRMYGRVYRALQWLERAALVQPAWSTPAIGPARRIYELSPLGSAAVDVCAPLFDHTVVVDRMPAARFLEARQRDLRGRRQTFHVPVEIALSVHARDERSARTMVARLFNSGQTFSPEVTAGADVVIGVPRIWTGPPG